MFQDEQTFICEIRTRRRFNVRVADNPDVDAQSPRDSYSSRSVLARSIVAILLVEKSLLGPVYSLAEASAHRDESVETVQKRLTFTVLPALKTRRCQKGLSPQIVTR